MEGDAAEIPPWEAWRLGLKRATRPMAPVRWYGGKGNRLGFIRPVLAAIAADVYCEPYFGAGSAFFALPRRGIEVINDLDQRLVNLYRVLQDEAQCADLVHRLTFTLYSRAEFVRALELRDDPDPVTAAAAIFTAQVQGFGGQANAPGDWGRAVVSSAPRTWCSHLRLLTEWHDRLQHTYIDCRDALAVIRAWDSPNTLFYLDPPYMAATRAWGSRVEYRHEADDAHHAALLALVPQLAGKVVISGYPHPDYEAALAGWHRLERKTSCYAAGRVRGSKLKGEGAARAQVPRAEVLWLNKAAVAACSVLL